MGWETVVKAGTACVSLVKRKKKVKAEHRTELGVRETWLGGGRGS